MEASELGCSPSLAVALDAWGQVIAHRSGTVSAPAWRVWSKTPLRVKRLQEPTIPTVREWIALGVTREESPHTRSGDRTLHVPISRDEQNHDGLRISSWELTRYWQCVCAADGSYPARPAPVPWVVDLVMASRTDGPRLAVAGGPGHPGDARPVALGYLTVCRMLAARCWRQGDNYNRPPVALASLLVWLFAVPHYADLATSVEDWCFRRYGGLNSEAMERRIEIHERQMRSLITSMNRRIR